jgi:hypothetical protein
LQWSSLGRPPWRGASFGLWLVREGTLPRLEQLCQYCPNPSPTWQKSGTEPGHRSAKTGPGALAWAMQGHGDTHSPVRRVVNNDRTVRQAPCSPLRFQVVLVAREVSRLHPRLLPPHPGRVPALRHEKESARAPRLGTGMAVTIGVMLVSAVYAAVLVYPLRWLCFLTP